jgi:hypothetical protein
MTESHIAVVVPTRVARTIMLRLKPIATSR